MILGRKDKMIKSMIKSVSDTVSDNYDELTSKINDMVKTDKITVEHKHTHTIDLFNTYKMLGKNMDNMSDADWKKTSKVMYKTFTSINKIVDKAIKDIK
tara:strand:+ start:146 stop:442 length:297 start_codon:yes stop_codon:yes gene_type:complete